MIEFRDDEIEQLQKAIAERLGFRLVDHRLELYGVPQEKDREGCRRRRRRERRVNRPMRFLCRECGTQYPDSATPPASCAICEEEREHVRWDGQDRLTLDELKQGDSIRIADEAEGATGFGITPAFAINETRAAAPIAGR